VSGSCTQCQLNLFSGFKERGIANQDPRVQRLATLLLNALQGSAHHVALMVIEVIVLDRLVLLSHGPCCVPMHQLIRAARAKLGST